MSVKVSLSEEVSKVKEFPKLMVTDEAFVVLFSADGVGTAISSDKHFPTGSFGKYWAMQSFKDYNGEVNLKNE
jgi:hypothetical protein